MVGVLFFILISKDDLFPFSFPLFSFQCLQRLDPIFMFVSYWLSRTLRIPLLILLRFSLDILSPLANEVEEPSLSSLNKLWLQNPSLDP